MGISIYQTLMESYSYDNLKVSLEKELTKFQDLVSKYINEDDEDSYSDTLGLILVPLNNVTNIFNNLGFTYEPDTTSDVEDIFTTILSRYSDQIDKFLSNFNRDEFESFNVQTRDLVSLIDIHRTRYIKEGEVLVDLSE